MNAYSLKLSFYVALLSTATSFAYAHTISTQPVSFDVAEASRGVMELITGETVVYDNARGARGSVFFTKGEIGDEVRIKTINGLSKYISQIQFEYFASLNTFESGQNGILKIYWDDSQKTEREEYTRLTDDEFDDLVENFVKNRKQLKQKVKEERGDLSRKKADAKLKAEPITESIAELKSSLADKGGP